MCVLSNLQPIFFEIGMFGFTNYNNEMYHDFNKNNEYHTCIFVLYMKKYFIQIYPCCLPCILYPIPTYHFPLQPSLETKKPLSAVCVQGCRSTWWSRSSLWLLSGYMKKTDFSSPGPTHQFPVVSQLELGFCKCLSCPCCHFDQLDFFASFMHAITATMTCVKQQCHVWKTMF